MIEKVKSEIQLKDIYLTESTFQGSQVLRQNQQIPKLQIDLQTSVEAKENWIISSVTVNLTSEQDPLFYIKATMTGEFKLQGTIPFSMDMFKYANAPAIVYPYLRQHIRSLSLDARIPPIIIPVINFDRFYQEQKKRKNL